MTRSDFEPFSRMLTLCAEQYGREMSPALVRFYFDGLSHLKLEQISVALNRHVRDAAVGQFMPKIADIIRQMERDISAQALDALSAMSRSDPITNEVIESMGGWRAYGLMDERNWHSFGQREFLRRYEIYAKRQQQNDVLPKEIADALKLE